MKRIILWIAFFLPYLMSAMENPTQQFTIINNHTYTVDLWYRLQNNPHVVMVRSIRSSQSVQLAPVEDNKIAVSAKNIKDRIITLENSDIPLILSDKGESGPNNTKVNFTTNQSMCRQQ